MSSPGISLWLNGSPFKRGNCNDDKVLPGERLRTLCRYAGCLLSLSSYPSLLLLVYMNKSFCSILASPANRRMTSWGAYRCDAIRSRSTMIYGNHYRCTFPYTLAQCWLEHPNNKSYFELERRFATYKLFWAENLKNSEARDRIRIIISIQ